MNAETNTSVTSGKNDVLIRVTNLKKHYNDAKPSAESSFIVYRAEFKGYVFAERSAYAIGDAPQFAQTQILSSKNAA